MDSTTIVPLLTDISTEMNLLLVSTAGNITNVDFNNTSVKTQLRLYDVLIPSLGCLIILLNFFVVVSSGLILKKGKIFF